MSTNEPVDSASAPSTGGTSGRGGRIVVGVDGSEVDEIVVGWAAAEAARRGAELHILLARALPGALAGPPEVIAAVMEIPREEVDAAVTAAAAIATRDHPALHVTSSTPEGNPAGCLINASEQANLVVVGEHGLGRFSAAALGATAMQVALHARCPVAVIDPAVKFRHPGSSSHVVVGVDGSVQALSAVRYALAAAGPGGHVELIRAYWPEAVDGPIPLPGPGDAADAGMAAQLGPGMAEVLAAARPDVSVGAQAVHGRAATVLAEAARDADLLVVASRGHGGFVGLLVGSVAQRLLMDAPVPLIVTRSS